MVVASPLCRMTGNFFFWWITLGWAGCARTSVTQLRAERARLSRRRRRGAIWARRPARAAWMMRSLYKSITGRSVGCCWRSGSVWRCHHRLKFADNYEAMK